MNKLRPISALREKQLAIASDVLSNAFHLIVSHMGSGKTAAVLTALLELLNTFTVRHVLIIGPLRVASDTWPDEIHTWEHTDCLDYAVAVGTEAERIAAIERRAEITIINRENLVWLAKHLDTVGKWFFDCVVIDESSMFKDGSKRTKTAKVKVKVGDIWEIVDQDTGECLFGDVTFPTKAEAEEWLEGERFIYDLIDGFLDNVAAMKTGAVKESRVRKGGNLTRFGVLTTARQKVRRIYELTGTPAPNGIIDLWGQIYLLDQGERLGRKKTAFLDRWFVQNKYTHEVKPRLGAEKEIMAAVSDIMVSYEKDQLVPDPVFIPVKVKLSPKVMKEYRDFEATLVSEPYDVEAVSNGVLANKLLQFANGSLYKEDGRVVPVHKEKLKALEELVEQAESESLLIFYSFKFDLDTILRRYPDAVVFNECPTAVRDWNAGKIKKLIAHPGSMAHGLNLQYGGHIIIWYGTTWSLELWLQANARLPRPGQLKIVAIYIIIAEGTYDENAMEVLEDREATQDMVTASVMRRLGIRK